MRIDNKLESMKKINELHLNKFPEQLFNKNEQDKVKEFLKNFNSLLISNLIDKIEITEEKKIYIYYKFKLN